MRAAVACFACLSAMASPAFAAPQKGSTPTYYLRGYYKLDNQRPTWQDSDASPWSEVKRNSPWVDQRLVKFGYVPFTHDSKNYYCLIDNGPRTGSHVIEVTFMCGDPATVQWLFQNNWRPNVPLIGGGPPLQSSLRSSSGN
jgi:hypothetical protein